MLHAPWRCELEGTPEISPNGAYKLWPASINDITKVKEYYNLSPVPNFDVDEVRVIDNQALTTAFYTNMQLLQRRKVELQFVPNWNNDKKDTLEQRYWRNVIYEDFLNFSRTYTDPEFPDVFLVPMWHGTKSIHLNSLLSCGYVALGNTDDGFFGKGVYSTKEAAYAYQFYSDGSLILNWISIFSIFPMIDKDFPKFCGRANHQNCDTHWVPVIPRESKPQNDVFIPAPPYKSSAFTECVIFQTAQCLPRYLVKLKMKLFKSPSLTAPPLNAQQLTGLAYCTQGLSDELNGKVTMAIAKYKKAMEMEYPPAYIQFFDCIISWGYTATISNPCCDVLGKYFPWFQMYGEIYCMARCYDEGIGVAKDHSMAVKLYQMVADEGDVLGCYWLGLCYEKGIGVETDEKKAVLCYEKSSKMGYPPAHSALGYCYQIGLGVNVDLNLAFECYLLASNNGHAGAQANIAFLYEKQNNFDDAIKWYQVAAAQGQLTSQFALGYFYERGIHVEKNLEQAIYYYSIATQQGHLEATYRLQQLSNTDNIIERQLENPEPSTSNANENPDIPEPNSPRKIISSLKKKFFK